MEQSGILLSSVAQTESDELHRVIGNTFIVDYGIIKGILADGIVRVEMLTATDTENVEITDCVLASFASQSVTFDIKPKVGDKVVVLFPRSYSGKMFSSETSEVIVSGSSKGYSVLGGIAILLNRYNEDEHTNFISFSEGSVTLKLAYKDSQNLLTFDSNTDGEFTLKSNNVEISADKNNAITVQNGKATITVDKDGNVVIDAQGKYTIKNGVTSLKEVTDGLAQEVENLTTVGSPATQSTSPASKGTIATWRSSKLNQFFAE